VKRDFSRSDLKLFGLIEGRDEIGDKVEEA
jgi:hypothetical protein